MQKKIHILEFSSFSNNITDQSRDADFITADDSDSLYRVTDSFFEKSMFFTRFNEIRHKISSNICNDGLGDTNNKFFSPVFLDVLFKNYITYLPLWTAVIVGEKSCNAPVKNYFNYLKIDIKKKIRKTL